MKVHSIVSWLVLTAIVVGCELILYWGGYRGELRFLSFSLLKNLCLLAALLLAVVNFRRFIKENRKKTLIGSLLICGLLGWDFFALTGARSLFFLGAKARLVKDIDPIQLQDWALKTLAEPRAGQDLYLPPEALPSFLKLPHWSEAVAHVRSHGTNDYVDVVWGSGAAGAFGIRVGSPGFVWNGGIFWKPGVYFYGMH